MVQSGPRNGWSELHISNNYIEGANVGLLFAPSGASDDSANDILVAGNHIRNVQRGIVAYKGSLTGLELSGNVIDCAQLGIALNGARCQDIVIAHNRIRQLGQMKAMMACIEVRNAHEVEIWNNHLESRHGYAVRVLDKSFGASAGMILRNVVRTQVDAFRIDGGRWEVVENHVRTASTFGTLKIGAEAHVTAASNIRGLRNTAPLDRGSIGDVVLTDGRASPPPGWWFDPSAQQGKGGWAVLASAKSASPPEGNGVESLERIASSSLP